MTALSTLKVVLLIFSISGAILTYPLGGWLIFAVLGTGSLVSIVFRYGWLITCIIAGTIVGFAMQPSVSSGNRVSQVQESIMWLLFGTMAGFMIGLLIDRNSSKQNPHGSA
jgi:hypothetical protein